MIASTHGAARLQNLRNVAHPRLCSKPWATVGVAPMIDPIARQISGNEYEENTKEIVGILAHPGQAMNASSRALRRERFVIETIPGRYGLRATR
jgi:hypothetical protein